MGKIPKNQLPWYPAFPSVPVPFAVAGALGDPQIRMTQPIGGIGMIDYFVGAIFLELCREQNALLLEHEPQIEEDDDLARDVARSAWKLARILVEERPEMPRGDENGASGLELTR